jgi:2-dehydro-3-deoxygluconokinase
MTSSMTSDGPITTHNAQPARPFDIVAFGEPMVEFNQTGEGAGRHYLQGFGGDTSNFAVAAARQGARVAYASAVGPDPYGQMLRALWTSESVDHSWVVTDTRAFTAIYFVTHDNAGHHFHFFRAGSAASRIDAQTLPSEVARSSSVFHLSSISLAISNSACDTGFSLMGAARAAGVQVSFDTNLRLKLWGAARARGVITEAIRQCDICLPGYDDMVTLTGMKDDDDIVDYCLSLGARVVALKLGERGALVASADERHRIGPHPCSAIDATGAGDTFGGAFVTRLISGDSLLQAARYASVAAALSTEGFGAVDPIPHKGRVLQVLTRSAGI